MKGGLMPRLSTAVALALTGVWLSTKGAAVVDKMAALSD
jgi:hypothetical protein